LAVTADANGRVNELRRKPSTSPAAYSTEVQSRSGHLAPHRYDTDDEKQIKNGAIGCCEKNVVSWQTRPIGNPAI
jgi:hypothetical protein